jgi:hypothetical protein
VDGKSNDKITVCQGAQGFTLSATASCTRYRRAFYRCWALPEQSLFVPKRPGGIRRYDAGNRITTLVEGGCIPLGLGREVDGEPSAERSSDCSQVFQVSFVVRVGPSCQVTRSLGQHGEPDAID